MSQSLIRYTGVEVFERMEFAVQQVRDRLFRVTALLEAGGVDYFVIGGNAVYAWVEQVDLEATRNTKDVDIAIRRADLPRAIAAVEPGGFKHESVAGVEMFLDGPQGSPKSAVHLLFAEEKVRDDDLAAVPDLSRKVRFTTFDIADLEALVQMKLTSYRRKDQVHILDMMGVGLVDATWPARYPPALAERLQTLLDDPDG